MRRNLLLVLVFCTIFNVLSAQTVKFGVISDIHADIMHDEHERLQDFLDAAKQNKVDFIIELGDFCFVTEKNDDFVARWDSFEGGKYHVLGNHDHDNATKEQYMKYVGMDRAYYSFDKGDFHFIVLDPNYLCVEGKYVPYGNANFYVDPKMRAWVNPEQVEWLKKDIESTDKRCVALSHQCLENTVGNREQIRAIFEAENERVGFKKVVAAFSGHDHTSYEKEINGITYIQINSSSNQWVGDKYQCETRYDESVYKDSPSLKYVIPYKDALYAIVTLKKKSMTLKGVQSEFVAPTPEDLNIPEDYSSCPLVPVINDVKLKF